MNKTIVMSLLLLILSTQVLSAEEDTISVERFRLLKTDGARIEGQWGVMSETGFEGLLSNGTLLSVDRDEILSLHQYMGNRIGRGALIGFGVGLVAALVAGGSSGDEKEGLSNIDLDVELRAGFFFAGGLIGTIIGATTHVWEPIPLEYDISFRIEPRDDKIFLTMSF